MAFFRLISRHFIINNTFNHFNQNKINYASIVSINRAKFCTEISEKEVNSKLKQKSEVIDRTRVIPVETSIKYLKSEAYQTTYGDKLVWVEYRRNHKGLLPPRTTRKTCIRKGVISTGTPCPICRDEYLILDHRNLDLLKQFISPYTGEILSYNKTGLCQKKHQELLIEVEKARDCGFLEFDVPFREYDYSEYYK